MVWKAKCFQGRFKKNCLGMVYMWRNMKYSFWVDVSFSLHEKKTSLCIKIYFMPFQCVISLCIKQRSTWTCEKCSLNVKWANYWTERLHQTCQPLEIWNIYWGSDLGCKSPHSPYSPVTARVGDQEIYHLTRSES